MALKTTSDTESIPASWADDERIAAQVEIERLEDLIILARVQLYRALKAQRKADEEGEEAALELIERQEGVVGKGPIQLWKKKRPDFFAIIDRLLGRIGRLTIQWATLKRLEAEKGEATAGKGITVAQLVMRAREIKRKRELDALQKNAEGTG